MTNRTKHPKHGIAPPPGANEPITATFLPRQRVGRLETVANWRREVGRLYRKMRSGEIPADIGTKLTYVASIGAKLAQIEEELREARRIADALEQQRQPLERLEASPAGQLTTEAVASSEPATDGEGQS